VQRPSFFIVGHPKSGTTALATFLGQHPDVFVCTPMEPNYFCPSWCRATGPPSRFRRLTEREYLGLFADAHPRQLAGEASAIYLTAPEAAAQIRAFDRNARIIMIFREPVSFLRSYHLQLLKNVPTEGEDQSDFAEAMRLEPLRERGAHIPSECVVPELLHYRRHLAYAEQYDRFAEHFPLDQLLPLVYDDYRRDNLGVVGEVFRFLGVDESFEPALGQHNVGGAALRSRSAQKWLHRATHSGGIAAAARAALPHRIRRRLIDSAYRRIAFRPAPPVDPGVAEEIRRWAQPQVAGLGERLGRNLLVEWNYDAASARSPAAAA
jgi:hypothetical protein